MRVYVKTPARLHLGLIDMNGDLGRMFGGLGVGIIRPNVVLEAEPSDKFAVSGEGSELIFDLAKRFFEAYNTKSNIRINLKQTIAAHVGLGSGTQLALAVATALSRVFGLEKSTTELALAMGRCQRTGVGTAIFEKGGFVVDGGKTLQNGVCNPDKASPLIFRQPFPEEWRFIVAIPNGSKGLANRKETAAFSQLRTMPTAEVGKLCRLTMIKLLPALVERDLACFGDALTQVQTVVGNTFADVQGGTYSNAASADCIEFMRRLGVHGVGQSSWGPTVYGVVMENEAKRIRKEVQSHLKKALGGDVFIAKANNRGATVRILD